MTRTLFSRPGFPGADPAPAPAPRFPAGTHIATPDGPRRIESLLAGDTVVTRDGPRAVSAVAVRMVAREEWAFARALWPVRVPVGSLGNSAPLRIAQGQRVLLSGPTVRRVCGCEEVAVAVGELVGLRGLLVERPLGTLRHHGIAFGGPAVIEAEGVLCEIDGEGSPTRDRETLRAAFTAMHAAGEPPLRGV